MAGEQRFSRQHASLQKTTQSRHNTASATGVFEAAQELVDVGGVVGGGDTQKLGEGVELLACSNECSAQVLARVLT